MSDLSTLTRYKLTIDDYHKPADVGILNEDSRVELIEGELIENVPDRSAPFVDDQSSYQTLGAGGWRHGRRIGPKFRPPVMEFRAAARLRIAAAPHGARSTGASPIPKTCCW